MAMEAVELGRKHQALRAGHQSSAMPGFPEGWFRVACTDELAPGQVQRLRYFNRDLVLFRTESGHAQVLDAFCAHLGANLAVGGRVVGETIACPFHSWRYGTDGVCRKIPYSDVIPKAAAVGAWPTVERSGLVLLWHSPVGNPPRWEAPELPGYGRPDFTDFVVRQRYVIRSWPQEILENVADVAHGMYVHGNAQMPQADTSFTGHVFKMVLRIDLPSVGGATENTVEAHGLGLVLNRATGHAAKAFWTTYTPIDLATVEVNFTMMAARNDASDPTGELSKKSLRATLIEFEKDIPIWENKIYREHPLLCPGDGPIAHYRRWARQFYPQGA